MTPKTTKSPIDKYKKLKAEAEKLGIDTKGKKDKELEKLIKEFKKGKSSKAKTTKKTTKGKGKGKKDSELVAMINKANKDIETGSHTVLNAAELATLLADTLNKTTFGTMSDLRRILGEKVPKDAQWEIIDEGRDPKNLYNKMIKIKLSTASGTATLPKDYSYRVRI